MASETDRITRTGVLKATVALEGVDATLTGIDPQGDTYARPLRRARGLSKALLAALYELIDIGVAVGRGRKHRQMTIDEMLRSVRQELGQSSPAAEKAVRQVAEQADAAESDGLTNEGAAAGPPAEPDPSAENVREFLAEPQIVSEALAELGRTIPAVAITAWTAEERQAALQWAREQATREEAVESAEPDPPEVLLRLYVEELDLTVSADAETLLASLEVPMPGEGEIDDQTYADLLAWADAAHRFDRGDADVDVPSCPEAFLPARDLPSMIFAHVDGEEDGADRAAVVARFQSDDFGAGFAVAAMIWAGWLVVEPGEVGDLLRAGDSSDVGEEALERIARQLAERERPAEAETDEAGGDDGAGDDEGDTQDGADDTGRDPQADPSLSVAEQAAFGAGYGHREQDGPETDNPHDPETAEGEHLAWNDGWRRADEVLAAAVVRDLEPEVAAEAEPDETAAPELEE